MHPIAYSCYLVSSLLVLCHKTAQTVEVRCAAAYALGSLYSRGPDPNAAANANMNGGTPPPASRPRSGGAGASAGRGAAGGVAERGSSDGGASPGASLQGMNGQAPSPAGGGRTPGRSVAGGVRKGLSGNVAWPSPGVGGCMGGAGGTVAGTSETRRMDELDIAVKLAEHYGDARCVSSEYCP